MKFFERLAHGLDTEPLCAALAAREDLWDEITLRQDWPTSPHHDTQCIWLRGPRSIDPVSIFTDLVAFDYLASELLHPAATELIRQAVDTIDALHLGRIMIVSLKAGGEVDRHWDAGQYAARYSRFHLALKSAEGNRFECGDETVHMQPGELWWFDHRSEHFVRNDSNEDRIHIIIDAVTPRHTPRQREEDK